MLEQLDEVPWEQLEHAYGSAADVPDQIRALASLDPDVRNKAYNVLWSSIIHQGTVYSATAHAVPFLLELLEAPETPDKPILLTLLTHLAYGSSYTYSHQDLFVDMGVFTEEMKQPEWQSQILEELKWVRAAFDAVVVGTPIYLTLLEHPDAEMRWSAGYTLSTCRNRAEAIIPVIQRALTREVDDRVQASFLLCLGFLMTTDSPPLLAKWVINGSVAPLPRVAAAISWLRVAGQDAGPLALDVLTQALIHPEPLNERYLPLPWSGHESIVAVVSDALGHLGRSAATFVVPQVLQALSTLPPRDMASISMVNLILLLCFEPRKKPWALEELTEFQQSVLEQLFERERTWDWGNVLLQFRSYGLPDRRQKLREFLRP
jgi:hypothetical protein